jgi:hypothetical protein
MIALLVIVVIIGAVLGVDFWRRSRAVELAAGSIPIYVDGQLIGGFVPSDLETLEQVSFTDAEEGKVQDGWRLSDVLALHVRARALVPMTVITVSSSSRDKSVELTWAEVSEPENMIMFDLSGRGTLKLASKLERLDTRDEWIQDVDRVDIETP